MANERHRDAAPPRSRATFARGASAPPRSPKRRCAHVAAVDGAVGAYLTVLADLARAQAARVDERVRAGEQLPLAGVPLAVKDNMCLDGTRTTCGSKILEHWIAPYTATAVARMLDAGAIPIGKANCDEFAMGSSCENSALGVTRNPYDLVARSRAARAAVRRRPSPRTKRRSAWAATPAARFASPARSAISSDSSRPTAAFRATD